RAMGQPADRTHPEPHSPGRIAEAGAARAPRDPPLPGGRRPAPTGSRPHLRRLAGPPPRPRRGYPRPPPPRGAPRIFGAWLPPLRGSAADISDPRAAELVPKSLGELYEAARAVL